MSEELARELVRLIQDAQELIPHDGIFSESDEWHARAEMALRRAENES